MNKFAVFDIDGTLIRWQLFHTVVNRLAKAGCLGSEASKIIKQDMMTWKTRQNNDAFHDYEHQLVKIYHQQLTNIKLTIFDKIIDEVFEEYKDQTYIYTKNLAKALKDEGYKLFIVSGSQVELVIKIARYYGFDDYVGMEYQRGEKNFTGKIITNSIDKELALKNLITKHNVITKGSLAIGDTKSDIPMLRLVDQPIAFNPNQILYDEAIKNSWQIVVERKNVTYQLRQINGQYVLGKF